MFDNIKLVSYISPPVEILNGVSKFHYRNILLEEKEYGAYYEGEYKGLLIRWTRTKIIIKNSIHKAYHQNNYSDFYYSDIVKMLIEVAHIFELELSLTKVSRLEFGLNIKTDGNPAEFINSLELLKKTPFYPMMRDIHVYGKKATFTQYTFKIYDKSYQVKKQAGVSIDENYLRIELSTMKAQILPFIKSAKDLLDKECIRKIFVKFMGLFNNIVVKPTLTLLSQINRSHVKTFFSGLDPNYWKTLKLLGGSSLKKGREEFNKVRTLIAQDNTTAEYIKEKLTEKFDMLLNG